MNNRLRIPALATAALAASFGLAACGSSGGSASSPTTGAPTTEAPTTGAPTTASTPTGPATTVAITETEFGISLPKSTFSAGTYTFEVKNVGKIAHALTIDGPGDDDVSTSVIAPGTSGKVTVTLKAGKYDFYCPVGDHKMEGMDESVTVS